MCYKAKIINHLISIIDGDNIYIALGFHDEFGSGNDIATIWQYRYKVSGETINNDDNINIANASKKDIYNDYNVLTDFYVRQKLNSCEKQDIEKNFQYGKKSKNNINYSDSKDKNNRTRISTISNKKYWVSIAKIQFKNISSLSLVKEGDNLYLEGDASHKYMANHWKSLDL